MCDIKQIPPTYLLKIMRQMDAVSFARLVCSCRGISRFVNSTKLIRIKTSSSLSLNAWEIAKDGFPLDENGLGTLKFFSLSLFKIYCEISDEKCRELCEILETYRVRCRCFHAVGLTPSQTTTLVSVLRPNSVILNLWHLESPEGFHLLNLEHCKNIFSLGCESLQWISLPLIDVMGKHNKVGLMVRSREGFENKLNTMFKDWQTCKKETGRFLKASVELFFPSERPDKYRMFEGIQLKLFKISRPRSLDLIPGETRLSLPQAESFVRFGIISRSADHKKIIVFEQFEDATRFHGRRWMFMFCFSRNTEELLEDLGQYCFGFTPVDFSNVRLREFGAENILGIDSL